MTDETSKYRTYDLFVWVWRAYIRQHWPLLITRQQKSQFQKFYHKTKDPESSFSKAVLQL